MKKGNLKNILFKVDKSPINGYGVFTEIPIEKGISILDISNADFYEKKWKDLTQNEISRSWFLPVTERNEYCRVYYNIIPFPFINHSRTPSCDWDVLGKKIVTNKFINVGEEITIDYRNEIRPTRTEWPKWI